MTTIKGPIELKGDKPLSEQLAAKVQESGDFKVKLPFTATGFKSTKDPGMPVEGVDPEGIGALGKKGKKDVPKKTKGASRTKKPKKK